MTNRPTTADEWAAAGKAARGYAVRVCIRMSLISHREDYRADDYRSAANEATVNAGRMYDTSRPAATFETYLFRAVQNSVLTEQRAIRRRVRDDTLRTRDWSAKVGDSLLPSWQILFGLELAICATLSDTDKDNFVKWFVEGYKPRTRHRSQYDRLMRHAQRVAEEHSLEAYLRPSGGHCPTTADPAGLPPASSIEPLSKDAKGLLAEAAKDSAGKLFRTNVPACQLVALSELFEHGLVRDCGFRLEVFEVTLRGFEQAYRVRKWKRAEVTPKTQDASGPV